MRKAVMFICIVCAISASMLAQPAAASKGIEPVDIPWTEIQPAACGEGIYAGNCQDCKMECQAGPVEKPCWGWKEVCKAVPAIVGYAASQACKNVNHWAAKAACVLVPIMGSITVCENIKVQNTCVDWDWCKSKKEVCKNVPCGG